MKQPQAPQTSTPEPWKAQAGGSQRVERDLSRACRRMRCAATVCRQLILDHRCRNRGSMAAAPYTPGYLRLGKKWDALTTRTPALVNPAMDKGRGT